MDCILRDISRLSRGLARLCWNVTKICLPFHAKAWRMVREPVIAFLNESDEGRRNQLTTVWRDTMLQQLTTIALTVSGLWYF